MTAYLVIIAKFGILDTVRAFKTATDAQALYKRWKPLEDNIEIDIYFKEIILEE
jgi:hypothetical protein